MGQVIVLAAVLVIAVGAGRPVQCKIVAARRHIVIAGGAAARHLGRGRFCGGCSGSGRQAEDRQGGGKQQFQRAAAGQFHGGSFRLNRTIRYFEEKSRSCRKSLLQVKNRPPSMIFYHIRLSFQLHRAISLYFQFSIQLQQWLPGYPRHALTYSRNVPHRKVIQGD